MGMHDRRPLACTFRGRSGPGGCEEELVEAAALHLEGPPGHSLSIEAIALAGALRTPALMDALRLLAATSAEEIERMTGRAYWGDETRMCAQALLDGTEPPRSFCEPMWWANAAQRRD